MPTPAAYIAIPSIGARFGSLENCLAFSAAVSSQCCHAQRPGYSRSSAISGIDGIAEPYIWWFQTVSGA